MKPYDAIYCEGILHKKYITEIKLNGEVVGGKPTNNAISINSNGMDDTVKRLAALYQGVFGGLSHIARLQYRRSESRGECRFTSEG